ncbi:MAG: hypothetical protein Q9170_005101, partial [Blastenia crenularia]
MDRDVGQDEEIDSDEDFGQEDEESFRGYTFRGSRTTRRGSFKQDQVNGNASDDAVGFSDMESDEVDQMSSESGSGSPSLQPASEDDDKDDDMEDQESQLSKSEASQSEASSPDTDMDSTPPPADDDRAALRKMMAESQKTITSNLSKAAKSDVAKGRAIKHQRTTFESLLNTRIRLQKALIATNSVQAPASTSGASTDPAVAAAEQAALKLWSTLDSLRQSLHPAPSPPAPHLEPSSTTPLSTLWTRMQSHEAKIHPHRISTLNKWSAKTAPASSVPRTNKFSSAPTQQPLSTVLEQQLTSTYNMEKLIAKTRIPRSCAPNQPLTSKSTQTPAPDNDEITPEPQPLPIYDDSPFYSLLLRDLLSSRSSATNDPTTNSLPISSRTPGIKDPNTRVRKKVDTKA